MAEVQENALARMARQTAGKLSNLLPRGVMNDAAQKALDREYRMHVEDAKAEGETPMTREEFLKMRGRS